VLSAGEVTRLGKDSEPVSIYRIRFHGRGGQGMKTASRILGSAFFLEGFEVQDAPRYGAERRGAPIFAYVRASRCRINERGIIHDPGLVIVADETLVPIPSAEVLHGVKDRTVLLINSAEKTDKWKERIAHAGPVLTFPAAPETADLLELRFVGAACAGAAARLVGVVSRASLEEAIRLELSHLGDAVVAKNMSMAMHPYDLMEAHAGCVAPAGEIPAVGFRRPDWVYMPFEDARVSAPAVFATATSERVKTGLWRTVRPVIDLELCKRCSLCSTYCPENAIATDEEGRPRMDYDHCKGCLLCLEQCPARAIRTVPEHIDPPGKAGGGRK
jgi:pyruvate ferredoxin oxidoreductase gamma subunit